MYKINSIADLDQFMANIWQEKLNSTLAKNIMEVLATGDKRLYGMWLSQVAHLTQHTSAHQAMVGMRFKEISFAYAKFCYEHALEEVGHEMMAIHDLNKIGIEVKKVQDLPVPLPSTQKLTAYLYYISQQGHPASRLGFSYWAEKCYPYLQGAAGMTQQKLGLDNKQMSFFVSHALIDEKHANDVENIIQHVCRTEGDWNAVAMGLEVTLNMAASIFEEIYDTVMNKREVSPYSEFLEKLAA